MLARGPAAAGCLVFASLLGSPAKAEDLYCDLAAPPSNAVVDADHGYYFFVFPDSLPAKFTGCKTWWIDTGERYMVFRLKDGRLMEMTMLEVRGAQDQPRYATCLYPEGALAKDAPKDCLTFEEAQSFAEHEMGTQGGPEVPPEKDIRTKTPL